MKSLDWLAGLFEGEGWITGVYHKTRKDLCSRSFTVTSGITMTDRDVIEEAAPFFNSKVHGPYSKGIHKPQFQIAAYGPNAFASLFPVFHLLGSRRREKIESLLTKWEHGTTS